tara:strand:- start:223 stop:702 length:480 start_codon:yes stop_codon:yes gene_type:complete
MELAQLISQIKVSDNGRDMDIARMIIPFVCEDTRTMGYISNCVQRFAPITDGIRHEFVSWEQPDNVTDKSIHLAYLEHNTQLQFQYIMCSTCGNYQCNNIDYMKVKTSISCKCADWQVTMDVIAEAENIDDNEDEFDDFNPHAYQEHLENDYIGDHDHP